MSTQQQQQEAAAEAANAARVRTALLLAALVLAGIVLVREGPQFDNTIDGMRLFINAFFGGALIGFVAWTRIFKVTPTLSLSGINRQPWLAALVLGLAASAACSYLNRTYTTPTERYITAPIDQVDEGKGGKWQLFVTPAPGQPERYFVDEATAAALKNQKSVRVRLARGAFGFDYAMSFEPAQP